METQDRKNGSSTTLLDGLRNPVRLRILVTGAMLFVGYLAVYVPISGAMSETSRKLSQEQKRGELARDIEQLRVQVDTFNDRLPQKIDTNDWVQYVLDGIRSFPIKLSTLDPDAPRRIGPYPIVVLRMELEGTYRDLESFVRWVEANERLMRVDDLQMTPSKNQKDILIMQLTVLGVTG